jgi:cytochrome P450
LKDFGFARKGMSEICENEVEHCLNDFRKMIENNGGRCVNVKMPDILARYILNTLWKFMAGIRYDIDNAEMRHLQKIFDDLFKVIDMKGALFSHFPFLQYIAPNASGYNNYVMCHKNIHSFMQKEVDLHKKNFNPSDEPSDLIDAYLKVLYSGDTDGKIHESFSEKQLLAVLLDMFIAGSETTNKASNFMMLHLIRNPQIQKKARKEIDRIIGRHRMPKLSDRVK